MKALAVAPTESASLPRALIGIGLVRHARLRPVAHEFRYPTWFLMLPMRSLRREADGVFEGTVVGAREGDTYRYAFTRGDAGFTRPAR